jgi:enoyl-CoA hydratase/carnithine racemase
MSLQPPTHSNAVKVSFPAEHVLLLCMNRPEVLNAMSVEMERDLKALFDWFDEEPSLWYALACDRWSNALCDNQFTFSLRRVVIITGEGRAFCAGADLKSSVLSFSL